MTFYQGLATVLLRVWALLEFVRAAKAIGAGGAGFFFNLSLDEQTNYYFWAWNAQVVLGLVAAVLAWVFAGYLSRRAAPASLTGETAAPTMQPDMLAATGSFLIGLFLIATSFPEAVADLIRLLDMRSREVALAGAPISRPYEILRLASEWGAVVLGLILIFTSPRLGRFFSWLRSAGHYQEEREEGNSEGGRA